MLEDISQIELPGYTIGQTYTKEILVGYSVIGGINESMYSRTHCQIKEASSLGVPRVYLAFETFPASTLADAMDLRQRLIEYALNYSVSSDI